MNKEYVQGFMDKCAELGVDPEKLAQVVANEEEEDQKQQQNWFQRHPYMTAGLGAAAGGGAALGLQSMPKGTLSGAYAGASQRVNQLIEAVKRYLPGSQSQVGATGIKPIPSVKSGNVGQVIGPGTVGGNTPAASAVPGSMKTPAAMTKKLTESNQTWHGGAKRLFGGTLGTMPNMKPTAPGLPGQI